MINLIICMFACLICQNFIPGALSDTALCINPGLGLTLRVHWVVSPPLLVYTFM